jgi:hypothetical protein
MPDITPWSSVEQFRTTLLPDWMPPEDRQRIAAYATFEDLYFSNPFGPDGQATLKLSTGEYPAVYLPDAQTIVNTTAYYLLRGLLIEAQEGPPEFAEALTGFLIREEFSSRFGIAKLSGVCRGDWFMHITADPSKPPGSRIALHSVHPSAVVPVYNADNLDQIDALHLVETFTEGRESKEVVRRLTYRYERTAGATRRVLVSEGIFDPAEKVTWYQEGGRPIRVTIPEHYLPDPIDTIPVYHYPNRPWQGEPFGSSELRGVEGLYATIGQQLTDAGTALSLEGLGVWQTERPVPDDRIYPGMVVQGAISRVKGIDDISPVVDYIQLLRGAAFEATGTSDIARGLVDVSVAESGVALALRFVPTLAKLELRELKALDRLRQMWFDFRAWWRAFEGADVSAAQITPRLGEKLPFNQTDFLAALDFALKNNLVDTDFARDELRRRLGWDIPADMGDRVLRTVSSLTAARDFGGGPEPGEEPDGQEGDTDGDTGADQDGTGQGG